MAITKESFTKLVQLALNYNASDIHIRTDERPCFRIQGDLVTVKSSILKKNDLKSIISVIMGDAKDYETFDQLSEVDGSYDMQGVCRVRYNILKYQGKLGIILRLISTQVPTSESLFLPSVINKIATANNGLVLVTGATGSGKSSTLAAMIDYVNKKKAVHILTLEDPIEYIHTPIKAKITQREIGMDTLDYTSALRSALRQDPDIILIGEMRDAETVSIALKAAETGHLVFGTVHTTDALSTVSRIISMFSPAEQNAVRSRVADNLYATISQRLLKTKDNKTRIAAQEIMITSPGVKEAISHESRVGEIYTYIKKGKRGVGTQTFDQHIMDLFNEDKISLEEAKANASSPDDFERNLMFGNEENDETGFL